MALTSKKDPNSLKKQSQLLKNRRRSAGNISAVQMSQLMNPNTTYGNLPESTGGGSEKKLSRKEQLNMLSPGVRRNGSGIDQNMTELEYLKFLQDNSGFQGNNMNESSFFRSMVNVEVGGITSSPGDAKAK